MVKHSRVKAGTSARSAAHRYGLFVDAYIRNGGNGTQAAIEAGYSPKTANEQAARLLAKVSVSQEIARRQNELAQRHRLRTEDVLIQLRRIVHSDPGMLYGAGGKKLAIQQLPDDVRGAIAAIEYDDDGAVRKVKFWDKNAAIEKAMKHLGLFKEDNKQKADPIRELLDIIANTEESRGASVIAKRNPGR